MKRTTRNTLILLLRKRVWILLKELLRVINVFKFLTPDKISHLLIHNYKRLTNSYKYFQRQICNETFQTFRNRLFLITYKTDCKELWLLNLLPVVPTNYQLTYLFL